MEFLVKGGKCPSIDQVIQALLPFRLFQKCREVLLDALPELISALG
ncbi:MAG: hypothetical protein LC114_14415 [Bryobacterales bacterium]|nr:hypothetical protein [Opitutaceae bacterium]MCZ2155071.1 hypothetical protein [Bryobacterales bacterium]